MSKFNKEASASVGNDRTLFIRKILLAMIVGAMAIILMYFAGIFSGQTLTAQKFVNLQEGSPPHAGFRRAHAKGVCISGYFDSNGKLAKYSTATIFKKGITAFSGRFSIAGNNPTAPDLQAPVRSLAFTLSPETSEEWRVAMNTPPVMAVATPDAFYSQLKAFSPDPVTKSRDPEKIKAFFAAHPESQAFIEWKASYVPANSFATELYHSINAFYLIDNSGKKQAVRWVAVPQTVEENLPKLESSSPDALQNQLSLLLEKQTVRFDLVFTLASDEDDVNNPTLPWPPERERVNAGALIITSSSPQESQQCSQNFDPLVLPNGMAATEDPILRARGAAYAESYRRRAKENLLGLNKN